MLNREESDLLVATSNDLRRVLRACPQPDIAYNALVTVATDVALVVLSEHPTLGARLVGELRDAVTSLDAAVALTQVPDDVTRH